VRGVSFRFPVLTFVLGVFAISLIATSSGSGSWHFGGPGPVPEDFGTALPDAFFGVGVNTLRSAFPLHGRMQPGTLGKLDGTSWRYIEPAKDCGPDPNTMCYQWGDGVSGLSGWVTFGQANGMQLVYDFDSMPAWMCPQNSSGDCTTLPTDLTWVSNFATAVATKFKGQINYYETYNEVDSLGEWTDTCSNLVLFHNTIYNAIKAVDPNALVGAPNVAVQVTAGACASSPTPLGDPSDSSIWVQNFLQSKDSNGRLPKVDTIGVHTYGTFAFPGCGSTTNPPCYVSTSYGCDWSKNKLHCAAQPLLNLYNAFRAVMNNNGLSSKQLLVTEGGFGPDVSPNGWCPSSSSYFNSSCLSPRQQVAYIGRWLALSASTWSDGSGQLPSWYSYDNNWGTLNGTNGMNPLNALAYGEMESWLKGAVFHQQCHTGTPSTVFVCDFLDGKGQQAQIVFNDNNGSTAQYTPPAWASSYQMLGGITGIISGSVKVGDTPIFVRGTGISTIGERAVLGSVVNAASFQPGPLAGGTLFTIFGLNLASVVARGQFPLPGQLAGLSVIINGLPAALLYVSPTQINAQIPYGLITGQAPLVLTTGGNALEPVNIQIAVTSPALFLWDQQHAAAENQDYSLNSRSKPAPPGEILIAYFTGQGTLDQPIATGVAALYTPLARVVAPTNASIGGLPAKVLFCGMTPGLVGLAQADIIVPDLPAGDYPLVLTVGGVSTKPGLVSIGPTR